MNTPLAITEFTKKLNVLRHVTAQIFLGLLNRTKEEWFSLGQETTLSVKDIELLIKQRNEARKSEDFQRPMKLEKN